MAEGAGIDLEDLWLSNLRHELLSIINQNAMEDLRLKKERQLRDVRGGASNSNEVDPRRQGKGFDILAVTSDGEFIGTRLISLCGRCLAQQETIFVSTYTCVFVLTGCFDVASSFI